MSYKIVSYALMKDINKAGEINVPPSGSINPCSGSMNAPQRLAPDRLPDPWLLDTEGLLSELARIRELALRIPPVRNDVPGPINSVVDAVWDLEQRLRYCLHLRCEAQRSFARQQDKNLPKGRNSKGERHGNPRAIAASYPLWGQDAARGYQIPKLPRNGLSGRRFAPSFLNGGAKNG